MKKIAQGAIGFQRNFKRGKKHGTVELGFKTIKEKNAKKETY